jgi:hypothetical protein
MAVFETFSKRQKKNKKTKSVDVYQYELIPREFRVQVIHIWADTIGPFVKLDHMLERLGAESESNKIWHHIQTTLARELGKFSLGDSHINDFEQCQQYLLNEDVDGVLDIELSFKIINSHLRKLDYVQKQEARIAQNPDDAINELNHRFHEHLIGYQFAGNQLVSPSGMVETPRLQAKRRLW